MGDASCSVTSANTDTVTCDLDDLNNLIGGQPFPVRLTVLNRSVVVQFVLYIMLYFYIEIH